MRDLSRLEMINAIAEVMVASEYYDDTFEDAVNVLNSDEISSYELDEVSGTTEQFNVSIVSSRGSEGDGAEMFLTVYVKSLKEEAQGYLEFYGRYSSWDSSYYYDSYVVKPEEVKVIQYTKVK